MSEGLDKREEAKEEGTAGGLTPYSQCPQAFSKAEEKDWPELVPVFLPVLLLGPIC